MQQYTDTLMTRSGLFLLSDSSPVFLFQLLANYLRYLPTFPELLETHEGIGDSFIFFTCELTGYGRLRLCNFRFIRPGRLPSVRVCTCRSKHGTEDEKQQIYRSKHYLCGDLCCYELVTRYPQSLRCCFCDRNCNCDADNIAPSAIVVISVDCSLPVGHVFFDCYSERKRTVKIDVWLSN